MLRVAPVFELIAADRLLLGQARTVTGVKRVVEQHAFEWTGLEPSV